jgi:hypothetical protein
MRDYYPQVRQFQTIRFEAARQAQLLDERETARDRAAAPRPQWGRRFGLVSAKACAES